jgi:hypothetical protein
MRCSHLYEVPRIVKFIESGSRLVVARGKRTDNGELLFNGCSIWKDEKV